MLLKDWFNTKHNGRYVGIIYDKTNFYSHIAGVKSVDDKRIKKYLNWIVTDVKTDVVGTTIVYIDKHND